MDRLDLEERIRERGRAFFASIAGEKPSVFNKDWWTGKLLDWCMRNESFRVDLFRFVDVLPSLTTRDALVRHIEEYFGGGGDIPPVLRWGARCSGAAGGIAAGLIATTIRKNIEAMARQFIIGENRAEALKTIRKVRTDGFAFTVDILGEAAVSEEEAITYLQSYLELLDALAAESGKWPALEDGGAPLDWRCAPRVNLAVKPTTLFSQADPADFDGSVEALAARFLPLLRKAREIGAFLCIDMEQHRFKDITLELYRTLRGHPEFRDYPHLGIALQSYLRETDHDLDALLSWARAERLPISIRLVKGAYWDYETVVAAQNGWESPVHTVKAESDAAFERHAERILHAHDICHLACASHNIRSIAAVMEMAEAFRVPPERYEFQALYGMAGPIRRGLRNIARRVRLYCPYGDLLPGMGYLVRRLLENTANDSFLRRSFAEEAAPETLLANPADAMRAKHRESPLPCPDEDRAGDADLTFTNEPQADFTRPAVREAFAGALDRVRGDLGRECPLFIGGREIRTDDVIDSLNPARPAEVVARIHQAGTAEIDLAVEAAAGAAAPWRMTPAADRAGYLRRAACLARRNIYDLASWQVLEVGKQWNQAYADVAEAIDFLEYYAAEMLRLAPPRRMGRAPGEINTYAYQPKGITAVIAPWNFPLAISCGMCAAAIVTGNTVLYKPSNLSAAVGMTLLDLFRETGLPDGVFNFVPGRGSVMGDYLVEHPRVATIAFTGSVEVGLRIAGRAVRPAPGQRHVKKVIAEMGGKNAIIIDDDADLDQAVPAVLASAFGFQGQKCSACSRVIVLDANYERFRERLMAAARSLPLGPAENPAYFMGPVVDAAARDKICGYIDLAGREGTVLVSVAGPADGGYYAPLTIVEGIRPEHRLAREEVFGPVLAVMRAKTFEQALDMANDSDFALTGGVFSRSPRHLELARWRFRVGNLYLNRGITGALVERQPFGGFRLSGIGSKAGGPDYLLQFMDPVCVTENTMRRGFAPQE